MTAYSEAQCAHDWPASDHKADVGVVAFAPLGHDFPGGVKAGDVLWLMNDLCTHLDALQQMSSGCWGWSWRPNKNDSTKLSRHARGIAIDYNAPQHPNAKRGTWGKTLVAAIDKLLERYEGLIRWGEHYTRTCDGMHFEINDSPTQVAALVRKLKAAAHAALKTKPTPTVDYPMEDPVTLLENDGASPKPHWFTVRQDLTAKASVTDDPTLVALQAQPDIYKTIGLNARQLNNIPTVKA